MTKLLTFAFLLFTTLSFSQSDNTSHEINVEFNDLAVIDVVTPTGNPNITLDTDWGITLAGEEVSVGTYLDSNDMNRLHYSVFSPQGGNKKFNISVQSSGFDGAGWTIDLQMIQGDFPNNPSEGTALQSLDLRDAATSTDVVEDIHKIAWTGTNVTTDGWGLKYLLKITDMNSFDAGSNLTSPVILTYTIYED